jgi:hypothetical protein
MTNKILAFTTLFILLAANSLTAQEELLKNLNAEIIKGTAFISYPSYSGTPYLNVKFQNGEIEFLDGTKVSNIGLRYSSYRDEIIYYNPYLLAQIVIDKISLKGFSFTDEKGVKRIFRRQNYDGYPNGDRYFEVLSDGEVSLLAYRKVALTTCDPSYSKLGLAYQPSYSYYIYAAGKGYSSLNLNRNSLLSKFDKPNQKLVKKVLRKNRVMITDESSFVLAWNLIKENRITISL